MLNTIKSRFWGRKFLVLFLILTSALFAQSWNNVVQTSIPYKSGTGTGIDQFSNKDGISVLVDYHNYVYPNHIYYLKYYLLNSSGSIIREFQFENQDVQFANIDGDNDKIYVVYKLGNYLKTRKSTNAGQSWTNIEDINIGNNNCNNVDIYFGKDDNALHIVWATQDAGSDYKTYYRRLPSSDQWSSTENVTDGSNVGGFPTVSKSQNRVHVSYNTGQSGDPETNLGEAKSRDKYTNTWQTPQLVFTPQSFRERIHAGSSKLFDFYYKLETGLGNYRSDLYVKERSFDSTSFSSPILLKISASVYEIISATNAYDGKTHIVYEIAGGVGYRNYNGSSWSSEENIGSGYNSPRIFSVSNDLFVVWGNDGYPYGNIQYRQYDAAPLAPQNLGAVATPDYHPKLLWTNTNADAKKYYIYRSTYNGGYTTPIAAVDHNSSLLSQFFIDYTISVPRPGGQAGAKYYYVVKTEDWGQNMSGFSNSVEVTSSNLYWEKILSDNTESVSEYVLDQNYPNPFNPSTKISYSIKEEGLVILKVYNILGKEVATLVNENKPAGIYEVEFDASQLPSGVYIYKLQAGGFSDVKKMLLTK